MLGSVIYRLLLFLLRNVRDMTKYADEEWKVFGNGDANVRLSMNDDNFPISKGIGHCIFQIINSLWSRMI